MLENWAVAGRLLQGTFVACALLAVAPAVLADSDDDDATNARISLTAYASPGAAPAGGGEDHERRSQGPPASHIVIGTVTAGETLGEVHVTVLDAEGDEVAEFERDGDGQATLDLTRPQVFVGQRVLVRATVRGPHHHRGRARVATTVVADAATGSIGPGGGVISSPSGVVLIVPAGAVDANTTIQVTATTTAPPAGVGAVSPVYQFSPEGIVFARPLTITLPLPAGVTSASIYWTDLGGTTFHSIGGTISGNTISQQTGHFSLAVVGQASPTRTVNGLAQTTYISQSARTTVPIDFTTHTVEALVLDNTGAFVSLPGSGAANGTFTIANVPTNGECILHSGRQYLVTTSNTPDFGFSVGGRPDATPVTLPTTLTVAVTGMSAFNNAVASAAPQRGFEFYATQSNGWWFGAEDFASPPINDGDTTATLALDLGSLACGNGPNLIEPSKGDTAILSQVAAAPMANGVPYYYLNKTATLIISGDLADGSNVSATAALATLPLTETLSLDWRGTQWLAALADGNPAHSFDGTTFGTLGQAGLLGDGFYTCNADPLLANDLVGADFATGSMAYPSPAVFGGNWATFGFVRASATVTLLLPGTTVGPVSQDRVQWVTTPQSLQAGPVIPLVSAPTAITVNGASYFAGGGGFGASPTMTWSAPRLGTAAFYVITVSELYIDPLHNPTGTRRKPVIARIITPDTSFTFPPGILVPGKHYYFVLASTAPTAPGAATLLAIEPFRSAIDTVGASATSGVFTP